MEQLTIKVCRFKSWKLIDGVQWMYRVREGGDLTSSQLNLCTCPQSQPHFLTTNSKPFCLLSTKQKKFKLNSKSCSLYCSASINLNISLELLTTNVY